MNKLENYHIKRERERHKKMDIRKEKEFNEYKLISCNDFSSTSKIVN